LEEKKAKAKELEGRLKPKLEDLKVKGKGNSSISSNKLESSFSLMGHKLLWLNYAFDDDFRALS
jgi:hypothetical protein